MTVQSDNKHWIKACEEFCKTRGFKLEHVNGDHFEYIVPLSGEHKVMYAKELASELFR